MIETLLLSLISAVFFVVPSIIAISVYRATKHMRVLHGSGSLSRAHSRAQPTERSGLPIFLYRLKLTFAAHYRK